MKIKLLLSFVMIANFIFAQSKSYEGRAKNEQIPKNGIIKGRAIDKQTKKPVMFANAALFSYKDSSVVAGTVADENGNFELKNLKYGRYYLVVDFIGYYKKTISDLKFNPKIIFSKIIPYLHSSELQA